MLRSTYKDGGESPSDEHEDEDVHAPPERFCDKDPAVKEQDRDLYCG